jgi:hypothetical protein
MVKRAPVNVRYLSLFEEHILTWSFTAFDPIETSSRTLLDHDVADFQRTFRVHRSG